MTEPFNVFEEAGAIAPRFDGARKLGMTLYELEHGDAVSRYHWEAGCEEWLVVVAGEPTLRTPAGERALEAGDVVCFPEGEAGAHQIVNRGDVAARVLFASTKPAVAFAVYPDD